MDLKFLYNLLPAAVLFLYAVSMAYNTGYGLVTPALVSSCVFGRRGKMVSQLNQLYSTLINVTEMRGLSTGLNFDMLWVSEDGTYSYDYRYDAGYGGDGFVNKSGKLNDNFVVEYRLNDSYGMIELDVSYSVNPIAVYYTVELARDGSFNITEYNQSYLGGDERIFGRLTYRFWDNDCSTPQTYSIVVISLFACIVVAILVTFMLSFFISKNLTLLRSIMYVIEQPVFGVADKVKRPIIFKKGQEYCRLGTKGEGDPFPTLGELSCISYPDYRCIILPKEKFPPTGQKVQQAGVDLEGQQADGKPTPGKLFGGSEKNEELECGEPEYRALFQKNKKFDGPELEASIDLDTVVAEKIRSYLFLVNLDHENYTAVEEDQGSRYFLRLDKLMKLMMKEKGKELIMIPAKEPFVAFSRSYLGPKTTRTCLMNLKPACPSCLTDYCKPNE